MRSFFKNITTLKTRLFFIIAPVITFCITVYALAEGEVPAVPAGSVAPVAGAGAPAGPQTGSTLMSMAPIGVMLIVFYFFMIRPQQKKMKEQQAMLNALQYGDEVVTASGVFGKVSGLTEKVVTLEIADDVKIKILRSQVAQVLKGPLKDAAV